MSGNGKDDPRTPSPRGVGEAHIGYSDDDVALTQKIARPKLPRIEKIVPERMEPPALLRGNQGSAVDASALLRARRISAPNHVAVRVPPEPASVADPTIARPAHIPREAYLPIESVPSTRPDGHDLEPQTMAHGQPSPHELFDDLTERGPVFLPDDADVESLRSSRDFEPRSLVTRQVPADVVRILRSRAALETEVVSELDGLPVLIPDSQAVPSSSGREPSEALVLTKLAPTPSPKPREPAGAAATMQSSLASTRLSSERGSAPRVAASPAPPQVTPSPQLHTLPLGMKPADFLAGLAQAEAHGQSPAGPPANAQRAGLPGPLPSLNEPDGSSGMAGFGGTAMMPGPLLTPSGEINLSGSGSNPRLAGPFASSGSLPAAQPSSGVFPQGTPGNPFPQGTPGQGFPVGPGPQRYPSGQTPAGPMQPPFGPYPSAPSGGAFGQGQGTFPPGSMQAPMQPQGTFPPGSMQAPMQPQGTFPPGSMQAPMQQGPGQGYPPGPMPGPLQNQGTFPPGSLPPSSAGQAGSPNSQGAQAPASTGPTRSKSKWVLMLLAVVVVLSCGGAWLAMKKKLPWKKHAGLPSTSASSTCSRPV